MPVRNLGKFLDSDPERERDPKRDFVRPLVWEAARLRELVRDFPKPLVREVEIEIEPEKALENEDFSVPVRDRPTDAVGLAEHDLGLLLQISFPESILATMLPMVRAIEPASVLK